MPGQGHQTSSDGPPIWPLPSDVENTQIWPTGAHRSSQLSDALFVSSLLWQSVCVTIVIVLDLFC